MGFRVGQSNFSKGEVAEQLIGRFDVPTYNAALKRARNVCILKYGGVTKRPGMRVVAEVYDRANPVRLLPFQFGLDQAYVLEMNYGQMRPLANGGVLLETEKTITGITKAALAVVTSAGHGYAVNDQVYFRGITGMIEINGLIGTIQSVTTDTFTVDIDSSNFTTFGSASNSASDLPNAGLGGKYDFDWRAFLESFGGLRL